MFGFLERLFEGPQQIGRRAAQKVIDERLPQMVEQAVLQHMASPEFAAMVRRVRDETFTKLKAQHANDPAKLAAIEANYARMTRPAGSRTASQAPGKASQRAAPAKPTDPKDIPHA